MQQGQHMYTQNSFLSHQCPQSRETRDTPSLSAQDRHCVTGMAGLPLASHHLLGERVQEEWGPFPEPLCTKSEGPGSLCHPRPVRGQAGHPAWPGLPALCHNRGEASSLAFPKHSVLECFHRGHQLESWGLCVACGQVLLYVFF